MSRIQKIMAAVDLSEYSQPVVDYAHELATALGAELILVNVYNERDERIIRTSLSTYNPELCEKIIAENMEYRRKSLGELMERVGGQKAVSRCIIRVGVPHQELLAAIESEKADLLVMGTKGRGNIADALVGSCANRMFRRSPIPVVMLPSVRKP